MIGKKYALLLCLALAGCAKADTAGTATQAQHIPVPTDEADEGERAQIDATLSRIEELTRTLGKPHTFRSVPVVVTTSNQYTDHPAACVALGGEPQFILVKPGVFTEEAQIAPGNIESSLFRVLLHEIGHCYFHREHEEAQIEEAGRMIELTVNQQGVSGRIQFPYLDATVMVPENLTVPIALEKYYVAEILGLARAKTLDDLVPYAPLKYVDERDTQ